MNAYWEEDLELNNTKRKRRASTERKETRLEGGSKKRREGTLVKLCEREEGLELTTQPGQKKGEAHRKPRTWEPSNYTTVGGRKTEDGRGNVGDAGAKSQPTPVLSTTLVRHPRGENQTGRGKRKVAGEKRGPRPVIVKK